MPTSSELAARDLRVVWHPCTQMKDHEWLPMVPIARGEGVWLHGYDGRRYLDAISSWWVNLFGHANPRIGGAVAEQLARLEHVMLAGFTHEPAVALAEQLTALAPAGPDPLLLRRQRLERDRGRAQDELPLLAQLRPAPQAALRHAHQQLPRRDARRARGRPRRTVSRDLPAAADGRDRRADPGLLREGARRKHRRLQPPHVPGDGGRRSRGTPTKSARSSSSRWCSAPAACACTTPCTSRCCATPATGTACT